MAETCSMAGLLLTRITVTLPPEHCGERTFRLVDTEGFISALNRDMNHEATATWPIHPDAVHPIRRLCALLSRRNRKRQRRYQHQKRKQ